LYAVSAWSGYISLDDMGLIIKVLCKAKRYGFTDSVPTFCELEQSDEQLFTRVVCIDHCWFHLHEQGNSLLQMSL